MDKKDPELNEQLFEMYQAGMSYRALSREMTILRKVRLSPQAIALRLKKIPGFEPRPPGKFRKSLGDRPHCPKCNAGDPVSNGSMWICSNCQHSWRNHVKLRRSKKDA